MLNILNQGLQPTANGNAKRGLFAQWFNADNIAAEDFERSEQSANNQFIRDMYMQQYANEYNSREAEKARAFNASEAQKQRDYDREMSNSQYTRLVADLKNAGLNPVLALGGSGASFHGGSGASSSGASASSARSSGGRTEKGFTDSSGAAVVNTLLGLAAGLITKIPTKNFKIGF